MSEHGAEASRAEFDRNIAWAKEFHDRKGTDWTTEPYIRRIREFGVNRNVDTDLLMNAHSDLSEIDLRHWPDDDEMKDAIKAAKDAVDQAMELAFTRFWASWRGDES